MMEINYKLVALAKAERITELEAELDQCLTAHAKLNDECEMLKRQSTDGTLLLKTFNAGMERAIKILFDMGYNDDDAEIDKLREEIK